MEDQGDEPPAKKPRPDGHNTFAPNLDRPILASSVLTTHLAALNSSVASSLSYVTSAIPVTTARPVAITTPVAVATTSDENAVAKDLLHLNEATSVSETTISAVQPTMISVPVTAVQEKTPIPVLQPVVMATETLPHVNPTLKLQEQVYPGLKLSTAVTVQSPGGQMPKPVAIVTTGNIRPTLQLLTVPSDRKQPPKPLTDVQVRIEIGHQSARLSSPTATGDTHDWKVFVRGADNYNIAFFVEKVVFSIQTAEESPKIVCRESPFQMGGVACNNLEISIKIYFKNKVEQKKVKFIYTVSLGPEPINHVRCEKIAFQNPTEDFRRKVLRAGGMMMGPSSPVFSEGQWTGDGKIRLKIAPAPVRPNPPRSPGITMAATTAPRHPTPQVVTLATRQQSPTSILSKAPFGQRITVTDAAKPQPTVQIISPSTEALKAEASKASGTTQISFQVPVNWTSVTQGSKSLLDSQKVSLVPVNPSEAKSLLQDSKQIPKNGVPGTKSSTDGMTTGAKTFMTGSKMVGSLQPTSPVINPGPAGLVTGSKPATVVSNSSILQSMTKNNQVLISNKPFTLVPSNPSQMTQIVKTDKKLNKGKITMAEAQIMLPSGPAKISWPVQPQLTTIESKQIVITNPMMKTTGSVVGAKSTCIVSQPPRLAGTVPTSGSGMTKYTTLSSIMPTAKIVEMANKSQAGGAGMRVTSSPKTTVLASQRNWELVKQSPQLNQQHLPAVATEAEIAKVVVKEDVKECEDKEDKTKDTDTTVAVEEFTKETNEGSSITANVSEEGDSGGNTNTEANVTVVKQDGAEKMEVGVVDEKGEESEIEEIPMDTEPTGPEVVKTEKKGPDEEDFSAVDAMNWKDGVGELPGSNLKFRMNDLGVLEVIGDDLECTETLNTSNESETVDGSDVSPEGKVVKTEPDADTGGKKIKKEGGEEGAEGNVSNKDEIVQCENCKEYGFRTDFYKAGRFCSQTCIEAFDSKKIRKVKKHGDLSMIMLGLKKGRKKLLMKDGLNREREQKAADAPPQGKKLKAFVWTKYLEQEKAVEAPARLFKNPFPGVKNHFRGGMRLEGIDPMHQSLFCSLSVAEVSGYRIRLHFDGYSECFDFWVDIDSPFIFPCGFCEKNGKNLQPPKGLSQDDFTWTSYLKMTKAVPAPKTLFSNQPVQSVLPNLFRVGSKLEAVDKKNSSLICVASVADTMGDKVLIHFDSWDDNYDYWCETTAPYIHAAGYCEENGYVLSPPIDWKDPDGFTWDKYLAKTKCQAVPARAFKARVPVAFEEGMKVEVVDKRNPILVRVATISEVDSYLVKIHFDGWSDNYDYWLDDDSPDLHPPGWCAKTGHPLVPPISPADLVVGSGPGVCPTPGCKGIGHIKGAKYSGHHSTFGCPYSDLNMNKENVLTDRLGPSIIKPDDPIGPGEQQQHPSPEHKRCPTEGCDSMGHVTGKCATHYKASGCPKLHAAQNGGVAKKWGRGRRPKSYYIELEEQRHAQEKERVEREENLRQGIHNSVFSSAMISTPKTEVPLCWEQHCKLLPGVTNIRGNSVSKWTIDQVAAFVNTLPGCEEQANVFKEEQIDGEAFLLLTQADIVKIMNIKLGPALKIFNSIIMFKNSIEV